jgi:uncharacterized membrane protein HdeD (DUF308 family)
MKSGDLAWKLWRVTLVRGLVALGLGAYALSRLIESPVTLARIVSAYWIFDGLVALWASSYAATLATNRTLLIVRGVGGIGAALILLNLPLAEVFGQWQPGQIVIFILSMVPALTAISLQIVLAATIDLLIGLEVRRQIPGAWSIALGAVISIVLSGLVAAGFFGFSTILGRLLGAVGVAGGLALIVGIVRLRPVR